MSLMSALNAAVTGLRSTQIGMDVVAQNVANADSAGYTRRRMLPVATVMGDQASGVRAGMVERTLDAVAQRQLRMETAGAAYTGLMAQYTNELDRLFGPPGGASALDSTFNAFTQSLQTLAANPSDYSARTGALNTASLLAGRLNNLSETVQALRGETEGRISAAVTRSNELLTAIGEVNQRIVSFSDQPPSAALLDERDRLIGELTRYMDVQVIPAQGNSVRLQTNAGLTLFDGAAVTRLSFDGRATMTPNSLYSTDPAQSTLGTITAISLSGNRTDVVANQMIRSGEIAAALELRDGLLVDAQRQLDQIAAEISSALSNVTRTGTNTSAAPATSFDLDVSGVRGGNQLTVDYRDVASGQTRRIIFVVGNATIPSEIPEGFIADSGATIIPVSFADAATAMNTALASRGINLSVTVAGASVLRMNDDGAGNTTDVLSFNGEFTQGSLTSGLPQLPFFVDGGRGNIPFSGSFNNGLPQLTGFAQRMVINPSLVADPSRLVVMSTSPMTPQGDTTRPQFLVDALTKSVRTISTAAGIGGTAGSFTSTVANYVRQVVDFQGASAEQAGRLNEGQSVALATVEARFAETSGVNIDQEMAILVQLQTAYGANARVMTAARDMMDMLFRL